MFVEKFSKALDILYRDSACARIQDDFSSLDSAILHTEPSGVSRKMCGARFKFFETFYTDLHSYSNTPSPL